LDECRHLGTTIYSLASWWIFQISRVEGTVEVTTLDSYCARTNITCIDLLKIDAEGHEPRILKGGNRTLERERIRAMILEVDDALEDFYRSLEGRGFWCFYYDFKQGCLLKVSPISATKIESLRPSAFHSNLLLIHKHALEHYREILPRSNGFNANTTRGDQRKGSAG
jgi:hypothetical protein